MRAPHAVQPSLMSSFRPCQPWYSPSDVCPSPFLAEAPHRLQNAHVHVLTNGFQPYGYAERWAVTQRVHLCSLECQVLSNSSIEGFSF